MKKTRQIRTFLAGFLAAVLTMALVFPAGAALTSKMIEVFTGISIYVDGELMNPTDANGNSVETFAYNGTTYVPLRAVSQYLGKSVKWDGKTQTVYIGAAQGEEQYLLDVCPPYQAVAYYGRDCYETPDFIVMAGQKYKKGFRFSSYSDYGGYLLFNLNSQYKTLEFDVGHIDGKDMDESTMYIYLDGELSFELDLKPEMMPKHCTINLNNALQMKIILGDDDNRYYYDGGCYALGNITVK